MRYLMAIALICGFASGPALDQDRESISKIRQDFYEAKEDGLASLEIDALSDRALDFAKQAESRGSFWSAISLVAELCEAGSHEDVHESRAKALGMLVNRFSDANRWSALVTDRFIPPLQRIPCEKWHEEIAAYDDLVNRLYASTTNDRVRAELLYSKARIRVKLNRLRDWLPEKDRRDAIELVKQIQASYGDLLCPGSSGENSYTVGQRATFDLYELEHLYFGAQAPPTVGSDLNGQALDIANYKGNIVVLDFWTTFCQPCLALVPSVRELLEKLNGEPVVYIGINGDADRSMGLRTSRRVNMTWRNLWDGPNGPTGPFAEAWSVQGWPSLFVLDADGRIRYKLVGKQAAEDSLEQAILTLLSELRETSS